MSYVRVIPRDLFNEASLLKCLGQLWLKTEKFAAHKFLMEQKANGFEVRQDCSTGATYVPSIVITINGKRYGHSRPLNSREPWPLWLVPWFDEDGEEIEVFNDAGELSAEFLALVEG